MAQRNSPSRRIPGEPLAGFLRTVAYQARYSNRRRADVATVTNSSAAAESAEAAAASGVAALNAPATMAEALAASGTSPEPEAQLMSASATRVAADPELPCNDAATLQVDENGRATWRYDDRGTVPHVVATPATNQAAVATVSVRTATSTVVHVWDMTGRPVAGCFVCVAALWP